MELAFAGLHQLCLSMLDHAERLPGPQREALRIAFGLDAGPPPDRFLVGLAVLSLLAGVAGKHPLVGVIDDVQWLDRASAQALGFVARRLAADPVGLVFAAREPGGELAGLPELEVEGLRDRDARTLLEEALTGPLDARVRDLIIAETRGNPLALLELPRGLTRAQLAGGFGLPAARPLPGRIEDSFTRQLDALPADTLQLVQLAAADPSGDRSLVWRAAGRLGISARAAAAPAVAAGPLDEFQQARADLVRGHVAFASGLGGGAPSLLLQAARRLEPFDSELARETYLVAWGAAAAAGASACEDVLLEICSAVQALPPARGTPRCLHLLLDGFARWSTGGCAAATPTLQRAVKALTDIAVEDVLRWGWVATGASTAVWDDQGMLAIYTRQVQLVRDAGALEQLPIHLSALSLAKAWTGDFAAAAALIAESDRVAAATGNRFPPYMALMLPALQGREAEAATIASAIEQAAPELGVAATIVHWAAAVLHNGLARYAEAAASARQAATDTFAPWLSMWALPELVEAAARSGNAALARDALERLAATTRPCGTGWALGIEARCRAMLSDGEVADELYREAIDRLSRTRLRPELARAHLMYGEWLRREGRRAGAREQLRTAHDMLAAIGMEAFAERARRELAAAGETVRKRTTEVPEVLTAQEAQIAWLARDGRTNPEIGAQLFLSSRTVEWHLRKIFTKLGIGSRRELHAALAQLGQDGLAT